MDQKAFLPAIPNSSNVCQRRPHARRFLKTIAITALVIFLFHRCLHKIWPSDIRSWGGRVKWPVPPDVDVDHCAQWSDENHRLVNVNDHPLVPPYSTSTSFELPIASDLLFLISRGPSAGLVQILYSNEVVDVAKVDISMEYYHPKDLRRRKACLVSRGEGQNGIGIFTSRWTRCRRGRPIQFKVVLHLPATSEGSPLQINNFATDMPFFVHKVGDLSKTVHFHSLSLKPLNMPISIESLSAGSANVTTTNSPIEGTFHTSSFLKLATANAHIKAVVDLFHDDEGKATELIATTVNAPLDASVSLWSSADGNTGGQFKVSAKTSLSPVDINFPVAPVDSILSLDATTAVSPANVKLHKTYEGSFSLMTSLNKPSLEYNDDVEDPAGRGRHRVVGVESHHGGSIDGTVAWLSPNDLDEVKSKGSVHVKTSLSPLLLML